MATGLWVLCTYEREKVNVNLRPGMTTKEVISEAAKLLNISAERADRLSAVRGGEVLQSDIAFQDAICGTDYRIYLIQLHREER